MVSQRRPRDRSQGHRDADAGVDPERTNPERESDQLDTDQLDERLAANQEQRQQPHTRFKHVLLEIQPPPSPGARLTFSNLSTDQPTLVVEDSHGPLAYTGVYEDMMGSVLLFSETKVTSVRREEGQGGEQAEGMDVPEAEAEGGAGGGGKSQVKVSTVTDLEGVANVKLVFKR
jgi:hypothetical protein